ncbi:PRC-barrel domain containing protein [candidate division KSB3 bacterium]|uniref:PRC-barrel domain containing protein n=1 Tax=candidate division KSB3 bacterium TaxID=2044937 RepID=A0A9D5JS98_9BACT|nr:PRC-barrel domain containing protein [candidate division KSB3 bacterium]MBD3323258.1 PRC-barrel domain containing protein [candidate division KSB3 bacterium]
MLRSIDSLSGYTLLATDGEVGKVQGFFFDDTRWNIRYLVVETGGWMHSRKVLIAPAALEQPDWEGKEFPTNLTREQVQSSPDIDVDKPVSRQQQVQLQQHYEWPGYVYPTFPPYPPPVRVSEEEKAPADEEEGDPHLRSTQEVIGYHIQATDGEIGHVEDFLADDEVWIIRYMVVDTRNWLPGKNVLIAPEWIRDLKWAERDVFVDLSREAVKESPEFDPSSPVDREYEELLYTHYSRPKYW